MLDHDTAVMDQLNKEDPLGAEDLVELEYLAVVTEVQELAAMSDDPSLSQLADQLLPKFWVSLGTAVSGSSAPVGRTIEAAGGNSSGAQ